MMVIAELQSRSGEPLRCRRPACLFVGQLACNGWAMDEATDIGHELTAGIIERASAYVLQPPAVTIRSSTSPALTKLIEAFAGTVGLAFTLLESAVLRKLGVYAGYVDEQSEELPTLPPGLFCPGGSNGRPHSQAHRRK